MNSYYLIGYTFGIIWEDETEVSEYSIVEGNSDLSKKKVGINTDFAKSLLGRNAGDEVSFVSNGVKNKFLLKYIECPQFVDVCKYRNVSTLYHFTPIENLESILKHGILSINKLKEKNIQYVYNDSERLENQPDYICFSVEYPNGMLLRNYMRTRHREYVLLEIDINVLNYKYARCCPVNAATARGGYVKSIADFYSLFEGSRHKDLPNNFPSDEQAEILIKDNVEPIYIKKVVFETLYSKNKFANIANSEVNYKLFKYRSDFLNLKVNFSTRPY